MKATIKKSVVKKAEKAMPKKAIKKTSQKAMAEEKMNGKLNKMKKKVFGI